MTTIQDLQQELDRLQAAADEYITEEGHCPGCYRYRYQEAVKQMHALRESIEWLQARNIGQEEVTK